MSTRSMSSLSRTLVLGLLAVLAGLVPATSLVTAQSNAEREIAAARERVQALLQQASMQELQAALRAIRRDR